MHIFACLQGRHALFFIATSVGMSPLEVQAWARWYATADQNGYMKNDEALLARLSRQQVRLLCQPRDNESLMPPPHCSRTCPSSREVLRKLSTHGRRKVTCVAVFRRRLIISGGSFGSPSMRSAWRRVNISQQSLPRSSPSLLRIYLSHSVMRRWNLSQPTLSRPTSLTMRTVNVAYTIEVVLRTSSLLRLIPSLPLRSSIVQTQTVGLHCMYPPQLLPRPFWRPPQLLPRPSW